MLRWFNCLRRPRRECVSLERTVSVGQREASAALRRAVAARQQAEDMRPESVELAAQLRELRERNHFAEALELLFRGGGPRWDGHS